MTLQTTYDEAGWPNGVVDVPGGGGGGGTPAIQFFTPNDAMFPFVGAAAGDQRNAHPLISFADAVDSFVVFQGVTPLDYAGNGITIFVTWAAGGGVVVGSAVFVGALERDAGATNLDVDNFGAELGGAIPAPAVNGEVTRTTITLVQALLDGLQPGDDYRIRVKRLGTNAFDTMAAAAQVISVFVKWEPTI